MKLSGIQTIFFAGIVATQYTTVAQNTNQCSDTNIEYQCPNPGGTYYPNKFDSYVKNVSLTDDSVSDNPREEAFKITGEVLHLTYGIIGGFFPWFNAAYQIANYALGYTALGEGDELSPLKEIESALNNIVTNFNQQIDETYDYIDERYDALQSYTEDLVADSVYLRSLKDNRRDLLTSLIDYSHELNDPDHGFDEGTTLNDLPQDVKWDLEDHLDDAVNECQSFFGSTSTAQSPIQVTPLFDENQDAKYRLMNAQEMCSGCLTVYSSLYALKNRSVHMNDLQYTMERCVVDVVPLIHEHIQDEVDLVSFYGFSRESNGTTGGEYDGNKYFGYRQACHSSCDRIKSCTNDEFADEVDYICTTQTENAAFCEDRYDSTNKIGAYPSTIAGACVGFGKKQIDEELMNYYRSSLMHGYGDIWAESLAAVNPQGQILSEHAPLTEGPFAIQSHYWGAFLHSDGVDYPGTISADKAYFKFLLNHDGNYMIQSSENNWDYLCDGIFGDIPVLQCEWAIIPLASEQGAVTTDTTLYVLQNTFTGGYLAPSLEADYTQTTGDMFRNERSVVVSTSFSLDLDFAFRIIRKCDIPGSCSECQVDSDCLGFSECNVSGGNICQTPAFTSKADLVAAVGDLEAAYDMYGPIYGWDVSQITNFDDLFSGKTSFNSDISQWNTASATSMIRMFSGASSFNQDIGGWNTRNVQSMVRMFQNAAKFNQNIGGWNTRNVVSMNQMFRGAAKFNQNIGRWNARSLSGTNAVKWMLTGASSFGQTFCWNNLNSYVDTSLIGSTYYSCAPSPAPTPAPTPQTQGGEGGVGGGGLSSGGGGGF